MKKITLIYRHRSSSFHSIENVFNALLPFLNPNKIELPYHSSGFLNRLKNILFIKKLNTVVYHITGHDYYLMLGLKDKKTILTIHDIEFIKRSSGLKRYLLKKLWIDIPIKNATYVTTISNFSKNELLSIGNYTTPIKVIYNPLTLPIQLTEKTFNSDCPNILHIGTKKNKNLLRLVEALKGVNCHLTIIGAINKNVIHQLKSNKISYTAKQDLSNADMINEYKNCDILSFISTYEGFGLPIIEAQAIGRVVITSNVSSIPEITNNSAILVNPFNVNEIKKGILELINNNELRGNLIKNGLENVKRFKPQKISEQYSALYHQLLNE